MSILEKLLSIQQELKAPKNQRNTFGGYNYRSCEDILEAVKPLCKKYCVVLILSDEMVEVGGRCYVKATAKLMDKEEEQQISNTAFAREAETKKGMDDSQITGTASSYARKYALNGLFCIDDTKDADTDEYKKNIDNRNANKAPSKPIEPPADVKCNMCGKVIPSAAKGGKTLSGAQIAEQTGGMCIPCYKKAQSAT